MCSEGVSGVITARVICFWMASRFMGGSYRFREQRRREELVGFHGFVVDFLEGGDAVVPLEQRGGMADALNSALIELPDRIDHRMIVRVENVFAVFGVAGDVNLRDAV